MERSCGRSWPQYRNSFDVFADQETAQLIDTGSGRLPACPIAQRDRAEQLKDRGQPVSGQIKATPGIVLFSYACRQTGGFAQFGRKQFMRVMRCSDHPLIGPHPERIKCAKGNLPRPSQIATNGFCENRTCLLLRPEPSSIRRKRCVGILCQGYATMGVDPGASSAQSGDRRHVRHGDVLLRDQ